MVTRARKRRKGPGRLAILLGSGMVMSAFLGAIISGPQPTDASPVPSPTAGPVPAISRPAPSRTTQRLRPQSGFSQGSRPGFSQAPAQVMRPRLRSRGS